MRLFKNPSISTPVLDDVTLAVSRHILSVLPKAPEHCPPIIFMHGFSGFSEIEIFGFSVLKYWQGISDHFDRLGYKTFTPAVSPFNAAEVRAEEWRKVIDQYRQDNHVDRVILVAHSQGAIDARLLVCPRIDAIRTSIGSLSGKGYGQHVDKLISLGGPHFGNASVDLMDGNSKMDRVMKEILELADKVGSGLTGKKQDAVAAIASLSQRYMIEEFNPYCVDDPSVDYYCLAGNPVSKTPKMPVLSHSFEDLMRIPTSIGGGENDGLVTVASALFGNGYQGASVDYMPPLGTSANSNWQVLGVVDADHVAMVGLPLDILSEKHYQQIKSMQGFVQLSESLAIMHADLKASSKRILEALQISAPTFAKKQDKLLKTA